MIRPFVFGLLLAVTGPSLHAGSSPVAYRIRFSELYATYDFIQKISAQSPPNSLRSLFEGSAYATAPAWALVDGFDTLMLIYNYDFPQYPPLQKLGFSARSQLEKHLVTSATIAEFQQRSFGIVPQEELVALCKVLTYFRPVYHALVVKPNAKRLDQQVKRFGAYLAKHDFSGLFATGTRFYGSTWDANNRFEVAVLPSLDRDRIGARAFEDVAICELPLELAEDRFDILLSELMHECYHVVYDAQPAQVKQQWKAWCDGTGSPHSQYALLLLNEALATALGNGWVTEQLTGKEDPDEWYNDPYVNGMAKAIYPVVKQYVAEGRPVDAAFLARYVELYGTGHPEWSKELDHLLTFRSVMVADRADGRYFRRTYPRYSSYRAMYPITAAGLEEMAGMPTTKVIVLSASPADDLRAVEAVFPAVAARRTDLSKAFVEVFDLEDRTKLILVNKLDREVGTVMEQYCPGRSLP